MKLKQHPEDFQVEELTDVVPSGGGPFALYRMEKRNRTTLDALQAIRRRWKIEPRRISYGGLKDRHAQTIQYFTIFHGPKRNLKHHDVVVHYLGQGTAPYTSKDIRGNRFQITLRDVRSEEIAPAQTALNEIRIDGVPNYFDDQRFGSVGDKGRFVARSLVLGRYEEALHFALAEPYPYDRALQKQEKVILRVHWRDWASCKALSPRGDARSVIDYLAGHPADFRGAVARLRPELLSLYLSAYQSYLWNGILARALERLCRPEQLVPIQLRLSTLPMHYWLDETQRTHLRRLSLPLPSARLRLDPTDPRAPLIEAILTQEGIPLKELKIRAFREPFFAKGERSALCLPGSLSDEIGEDEHHPGRRKLVLSFELPRGSYATLIMKRIQQSFRRAPKGNPGIAPRAGARLND
jgi:tRNA pseudouridine13 synthase